MVSLRSPWRWRVLAGAVAVLCTQFISVGDAAASPRDPVEVSISWTMADRFGLDVNADGRLDLPNSAAYVAAAHPWECDPVCPEPRFSVTLAGTVLYRGEEVPLRALEYRWEIDGGTPEEFSVEKGLPDVTVDLPEGVHDVRLEVVYQVPWGTTTLAGHEKVTVDDLLVVAIGDSYVSGEGNPEVDRVANGGEALWGDGVGDELIEGEHAAAHRSTVSWAARSALELERGDPGTSVTFLSLAASGATIDRGLLGPQNAALPTPQMDRVKELTGSRRIDALLISIGGNDIGFSSLIKELVDADPLLDPICYETDLANVWASVRDGRWNRDSRLAFGENGSILSCRSVTTDDQRTLAGLEGLPEEFARLDAAISALDVTSVYLMEYPDPTGSDEGACSEIVEDAAPFGFHEIDASEQRLGRDLVLDPLNTALVEAAGRHGWTLVSGIAEGFANGHGYCAPWPDYGYPVAYEEAPALFRDRLDHPSGWYRNPGPASSLPELGPASWYRTAGQSAVLQGPDDRTETTGTMHPNELGHLAMSRLLLAALSG